MSKIILNNLFVGSFGFDEENIPIEVINFYRDDENNCYVYLPPRGHLKNKVTEIEAIIFVRTAYTGVVEVIGKTGRITDTFVNGLEYYNQTGKIKHMPEEQKFASASIKYGGCTLEEIFGCNRTGETVYVSCGVEYLSIPNRTCFIAMSEEYAKKAMLDPDDYIVIDEKVNNQSMRQIVDEDTQPEVYKELQKLMNDSARWIILRDNTYDHEKQKIADDDNILTAVRQQDNEVIFSNMLYYFLSKYKESVLPEFAERVLNCKIRVDRGTVVQREKKRMDISIITDDTYIIIENKIKSGINGVKELPDKDNKIESQLSKYYSIAETENLESGKNREIRCYILHPQYMHLNLNDYERGNEYCKVSYKKLYNFFGDLIESHKEDSVFDESDMYYAMQFHRALYRHTTETDCSQRNEFLKRLKVRINKITSGAN